MTTPTQQHPTKRDPRMPLLERDVAMRLATTEYERVAVQFENLHPEQWTPQTEMPRLGRAGDGWTHAGHGSDEGEHA